MWRNACLVQISTYCSPYGPCVWAAPPLAAYWTVRTAVKIVTLCVISWLTCWLFLMPCVHPEVRRCSVRIFIFHLKLRTYIGISISWSEGFSADSGMRRGYPTHTCFQQVALLTTFVILQSSLCLCQLFWASSRQRWVGRLQDLVQC